VSASDAAMNGLADAAKPMARHQHPASCLHSQHPC